MKKSLILFIGILSFTSLWAQRPGGPGGGPETMIAREKQMVMEKVPELSNDQKLLLDGIYDEFSVSLKEVFQKRGSEDREVMRKKIQALRTEKDDLIKDVLNEEQYSIYESLSRPKRERQEESMNKR